MDTDAEEEFRSTHSDRKLSTAEDNGDDRDKPKKEPRTSAGQPAKKTDDDKALKMSTGIFLSDGEGLDEDVLDADDNTSASTGKKRRRMTRTGTESNPAASASTAKGKKQPTTTTTAATSASGDEAPPPLLRR
jgi:hypothetical protein